MDVSNPYFKNGCACPVHTLSNMWLKAGLSGTTENAVTCEKINAAHNNNEECQNKYVVSTIASLRALVITLNTVFKRVVFFFIMCKLKMATQQDEL